MKNLPIPIKDVDERTIYYECADNFTDKTALSYIEEVVSCASVYEKYVPKDIEHLPQYMIQPEDKPKIINVYKEKFVGHPVGRKYYEAIMVNAKGRCPICGSGKVKNLDHFLPKDSYPLLCVTPANLIPLCRDCNFDKGKFTDTDYYLIPFNPYFDSMEDTWLVCYVTLIDGGTFEVEYKNGYNKSVNEKLWIKYEMHMKVFDLNATFTARACEEIENCKQKYKNMLSICGADDVMHDLIEHRDSCEHIDINSWSSALYRELVREVDAFCKWLL